MSREVERESDTAARTGRSVRQFGRWLAVAIAAAACVSATPAQALTITLNSIAAQDGSGFTLRERFGVVSSTVGSALVSHIINIDDCLYYQAQKKPVIDINWSWTDKPALQLTPQYGLKIAAPGKSCDPNTLIEPTTSTSGCVQLIQTANFTTPTAIGQINSVDLHTLLDGVNCHGNADSDANIYFIVNTNTTTGGTAASGIALNIHLGLARPNPPTMSSTIGSGDGNLHVSWTAPTGSTTTTTPRYRVYWSTTAFGAATVADAPSHSDALTATSYQIKGLTNGQTYYIAVTTVDGNDNESVGSSVESAIPIPTQDFWKYYKSQGGAEEGGYGACSAGRAQAGGDGAWLLLIACVLCLLAVRRRRAATTLGVLMLATALLAPQAAMAASPQTMSIELRVGTYKPNMDREFAGTTGATPYADILGASDWQFGLGLDWRTLHGYWGELAFGFSAGRWTKEGTARAVGGGSTSDTTSLTILPLSLDVAYRFTTLADQWQFPLVPYAKAGIGYSLWWMENGVGNISRFTSAGSTQLARGGTGGLYGTVGVRLLLDVFEPQAARSFDIEMGVNHSYLFAEYQMLNLTDFGNKKSIDLSDNLFLFGVAFDL